jgi:hypothetical protein
LAAFGRLSAVPLSNAFIHLMDEACDDDAASFEMIVQQDLGRDDLRHRAPASYGERVRQHALDAGEQPSRSVEEKAPRRGRALINREKMALAGHAAAS